MGLCVCVDQAARLTFLTWLSRTMILFVVLEFGMRGCVDCGLENRKLRVSGKDLNYDYSSEHGVLHVFLDNVQLQKMNQVGFATPWLSFVILLFFNLSIGSFVHPSPH